MGASGEVMLRFQLLETSYWSILAARKPQGMSLDQHMVNLSEWDRQTGERLINALRQPDELHARQLRRSARETSWRISFSVNGRRPWATPAPASRPQRRWP